ncbi:MAG: cation diffusion facilitator family transporter [Candidatus Lokiarchaeota archaeon]|nr:cation diffusion facilitator family transporter [Candidatus Lokiarchaeota archaeon]
MEKDYAFKILKKGQKASLIGISISTILTVIKLVFGYLSNSGSLMTDAFNSGFDVIVMVASWIGFRIAAIKPTKKFPYGFYKAESLFTLGISIFIIYFGITLIIEGYNRIFFLPEISYTILSSFIAIISIIGALGSSIYLQKTGKNINSQLLIASSKDRLGDVFASSSALISIILTYFRIPMVDGIVIIIISGLILRLGIITIKESIFNLLDISPSKEINDQIENIIYNNQKIEEFHDLKLRKSGPFIYGEVHISLKKEIPLIITHQICDSLEDNIHNKIKELQKFTIHCEPSNSEISYEEKIDKLKGKQDQFELKKFKRRILRIVKSFKQIKGFEDLKINQANHYFYGEITIKIKKNIHTDKAHKIVSDLEHTILENIDILKSFYIHIEPY